MTHGHLGQIPQPPTPWPYCDLRAQAEELALRREAADILRRSRWYRDECLRELLLQRRWFLVQMLPPWEAG
jgi:hypothetical protein